MDNDLHLGSVSLEIIVHISARVTNDEDDIYRKQARAIGAFLNSRVQANDTISGMARNRALVLQAPLPPELPKGRRVNRNPRRLQQLNPVVTESILVSASSKESASLEPLLLPQKICEEDVPAVQNRIPKSPTSSTASVRGDVLSQSTASLSQGTNPASYRRSLRDIITPCRDTESGDYAAVSTQSTTITPDSAGFVLRSPTYLRARKRAFPDASEEPRKAQETVILAERSPNQGVKRQRLKTTSNKDSSVDINNRDDSQARLNHWSGSIVQFSSSIADESTQPAPSAAVDAKPSPPCRTYLSPWPQTGTDHYTTHKVGVFAYIAGNTSLCTAYKPKSTKRPIEPMERGYWHLKIPSSWSTKSQEDFWNLLESTIVEGKGGWGNWVEHVNRSLDNDDDPLDTDEKNSAFNQTYVDEIKVWCWGEVVREMWLVILMASRRQTVRSKMAWHDSCGEIIVQMR